MRLPARVCIEGQRYRFENRDLLCYDDCGIVMAARGAYRTLNLATKIENLKSKKGRLREARHRLQARASKQAQNVVELPEY